MCACARVLTETAAQGWGQSASITERCSPIGTSGRDSFMHCHGSLQLGVKIPESLVCSMRWRGVDNAPADADPALASLARKVVALGRILLGRGQRLALTSRTAPPAGVARTVAQELWGVRRNPSACSTHPRAPGHTWVLGLILLRNLASFCQNTRDFLNQ